MSGVKGKSGGARPNTGGKRPGAGRKPKPRVEVLHAASQDAAPNSHAAPADDDALKLLLDIAYGRVETTPLQVRAAVAAVQYTHAKVGEGGKKEQKNADAKKVAGRFTPAAPPRLVAVGGKRT